LGEGLDDRLGDCVDPIGVQRSAGGGFVRSRFCRVSIDQMTHSRFSGRIAVYSPFPPSKLNRGSSFFNLRVADIWACYEQWGDKGAFFLAERLHNHGWEWRCYMRDPTTISSRSDNILKSPSIGSTTPVNFASDKQEDIQSLLGSTLVFCGAMPCQFETSCEP